MIDNIKELQISALSRINFCFYELRNYPPMDWINSVINKDSVTSSKENYLKMNKQQQRMFNKDLFKYLDRESTTEARMMLIINYLAALLLKGSNNQISIHNNFSDKIEEIKKFEKENSDLYLRIKIARDKFYAHIDLNWITVVKEISFNELQKCIDFLNKLFDYDFETIKKFG